MDRTAAVLHIGNDVGHTALKGGWGTESRDCHGQGVHVQLVDMYRLHLIKQYGKHILDN